MVRIHGRRPAADSKEAALGKAPQAGDLLNGKEKCAFDYFVKKRSAAACAADHPGYSQLGLLDLHMQRWRRLESCEQALYKALANLRGKRLTFVALSARKSQRRGAPVAAAVTLLSSLLRALTSAAAASRKLAKRRGDKAAFQLLRGEATLLGQALEECPPPLCAEVRCHAAVSGVDDEENQSRLQEMQKALGATLVQRLLEGWRRFRGEDLDDEDQAVPPPIVDAGFSGDLGDDTRLKVVSMLMAVVSRHPSRCASAICDSVETALFEAFGKDPQEYRLRARALLFNLRAADGALLQQVLHADIEPSRLVQLPSEELATTALKAERRAQREKHFRTQVYDKDGPPTCRRDLFGRRLPMKPPQYSATWGGKEMAPSQGRRFSVGGQRRRFPQRPPGAALQDRGSIAAAVQDAGSAHQAICALEEDIAAASPAVPEMHAAPKCGSSSIPGRQPDDTDLSSEALKACSLAGASGACKPYETLVARPELHGEGMSQSSDSSTDSASSSSSSSSASSIDRVLNARHVGSAAAPVHMAKAICARSHLAATPAVTKFSAASELVGGRTSCAPRQPSATVDASSSAAPAMFSQTLLVTEFGLKHRAEGSVFKPAAGACPLSWVISARVASLVRGPELSAQEDCTAVAAPPSGLRDRASCQTTKRVAHAKDVEADAAHRTLTRKRHRQDSPTAPTDAKRSGQASRKHGPPAAGSAKTPSAKTARRSMSPRTSSTAAGPQQPQQSAAPSKASSSGDARTPPLSTTTGVARSEANDDDETGGVWVLQRVGKRLCRRVLLDADAAHQSGVLDTVPAASRSAPDPASTDLADATTKSAGVRDCQRSSKAVRAFRAGA
eukprot:TRINITY_DN19393_c0_g1_i2.p1 TRINITY_DN19393_c0_g1~~TRINITY_DN19393_c0_g1_i2.p1  ORF type:complete len:845 (-),score=171.88 TRINITY_DN19393_c0_g1_i2:59-2593(-)